MRKQCGPACQACDQLLDFAVRCNLDRDAPTFFNKGDVNRMFRHILENPIYQQYEPIVHSRPGGDSTDPNVLDGPWVVTVENFTSPQECERLIEVSEDVGFKPSYGAMGQRDKDGRRERIQTEFRTSKSAYCLQACDLDTNIQTLTGRMENITGAPHSHLQYLHFMKYESSELYKLHSDYAKEHREQLHGVRLLMFLVYLDDVEDGGGTNFPQLNITVQPKQGRALLWPSVLDEDPNAEEKRTQHQSLPVNKGVKAADYHHVYLPARFQEAICATLHHLVELAVLVNCLEKQSNSIHFTFRFFSIHSWVALTATRCKQFQGWLRQTWPGSMQEVKDASTGELSVPCVNDPSDFEHV